MHKRRVIKNGFVYCIAFMGMLQLTGCSIITAMRQSSYNPLVKSLGDSERVVVIHAYDGTTKPDKELAGLFFGRAASDSELTLFKIDEKLGRYSTQHGTFNVRMLPGRHSLEFYSANITPVKITFTAEEGKKYYAMSEKDKVYIQDDRGIRFDTAEEKLQAYTNARQSDAALIKQSGTTFDKFALTVFRIDGKYGDETIWYRFNSAFNGSISVKLAPGEHRFEYVVSKSGIYPVEMFATQNVSVEAGKRYSLKTNFNEAGKPQLVLVEME